MEDVKLYYERESHWRMVFEENGGGLDDKKALLHSKRLDLMVNGRESLLKVGIWCKFWVLEGRRLFAKW